MWGEGQIKTVLTNQIRYQFAAVSAGRAEFVSWTNNCVTRDQIKLSAKQDDRQSYIELDILCIILPEKFDVC